MPGHEIGNTAPAVGWKRFLGKTAVELTRALGAPSVSYGFHDDEVYLYESKPVTTIAIRKGVVVKCNDMSETRRAIRVQPSERISFIARGEGKIKGQLKDISVAGAAVLHDPGMGLPVGSRVEVSFALPIDGIDRFLQLPGRVKDTRIDKGIHSTVFLFDLTSSPEKKKLLSRYVQLRRIQNELELDDSVFLGNLRPVLDGSVRNN